MVAAAAAIAPAGAVAAGSNSAPERKPAESKVRLLEAGAVTLSVPFVEAIVEFVSATAVGDRVAGGGAEGSQPLRSISRGGESPGSRAGVTAATAVAAESVELGSTVDDPEKTQCQRGRDANVTMEHAPEKALPVIAAATRPTGVALSL